MRTACAPRPRSAYSRNGLWEDGLLPVSASMPTSGLSNGAFRKPWRAEGSLRPRWAAAFAIPMELSSRDPRWLALDRISFGRWLEEQGFTAPTLRWLADYACRDDYACARIRPRPGPASIISPAAMGGGHAAGDSVLTAPDGNGWLVRGLARRRRGASPPEPLVWRVREKSSRSRDRLLAAGGKPQLPLPARQLIWAAPVFLPPRVWKYARAGRGSGPAGDYAPWLVANLHLAGIFRRTPGAPPPGTTSSTKARGLGYGSPPTS